MTTSIKNALPQLLNTGFDDQSTREQLADPEQNPIHAPLIHTYARKGKEDRVYFGTGYISKALGAETLDLRGKYKNLFTPYLVGFIEQANATHVQRIRPAGAKSATLRLIADVQPINVILSDASSAAGTEITYRIEEVVDSIGVGAVGPGLTSVESVQSTAYPIFDFEYIYFGEVGSLTGIRIWSPNTEGTDPIDYDLAIGQQSYIHKFQLIEKPSVNSSGLVKKTVFGDTDVDFSLNPDAINTNTDGELYIDNVILPAYQDVEARYSDYPEDGPFEHLYIYQDNIDAVLEAIHTNESAAATTLFGDVSEELANKYLINVFGTTDINGADYLTHSVKGALDGAPEFTDVAVHYLVGGDDGIMSPEAFEQSVSDELDTFGEGAITWLDQARYPISAYYDPGFTMATKLKIPQLLSKCRHVHVALASQVASAPINNLTEDWSSAVALRTALRNHPESELFGTAMTRGVIVQQAGKIVNSKWLGTTPGTYELAMKRASYMGASNGVMKSAEAYDSEKGKIVKYLSKLNNTWKPTSAGVRDWETGVIWAQYHDSKRLYYPTTQTAYDRDDSVLNLDINMMIATDLNHVAFRVWRSLVGNAKLTPKQFIQRSNERIIEETSGRYDGRVIIVPNTYYTPADKNRGFSWHCGIHMYANTAKTVGTQTVITHRLEDLV